MVDLASDENYVSPIAIGGVGGSGTRVIANIVDSLGFYLGSDLNPQKDNLCFSYLFNNHRTWNSTDDYILKLSNVFYHKMRFGKLDFLQDTDIMERLKYVERPNFLKEWPRHRYRSLKTNHPIPDSNPKWGWKEPNTHLFVDRIANHFPGIKYIHVMRHGVDMAFSKNQFQLQRWGQLVLNEKININPHYSLKYWCAVHKRLDQIKKLLGSHFHLINFDLLCEQPSQEISNLMNFLDINADKQTIKALMQLVAKPKTVGRHLNKDLSVFNQDDLEFVEQMGYKISAR